MKEQNNILGKDSKDPKSILDPETERLRRDIFRSDMEKLILFTRMLRTNALFKKAVITHK